MTNTLSQISISEPTKKKKKRRNKEKKNRKIENMNEQPVYSEESPAPLYGYLNASDRKFKQMLSIALEGAQDVATWIDTDEKLQFIREYARLFDKSFYLNMEYDLWENFYTLGQSVNCWTSPSISKTIAKENQMSCIYLKSKASVEKHRQRNLQKFQQAVDELQQHMTLLERYQQSAPTLMDTTRLSAAVMALVRKGQNDLSKDYSHRKTLHQFAANDYQLVKNFYYSQPNDEEVVCLQSHFLTVDIFHFF